MTDSSLTAAIIGHLVGDFVFQCDRTVRDKKSDSALCLLHCLVVALWVYALSMWPFRWSIVVALTLGHFALDRTDVVTRWMHWSGQSGFAQPPFAPWSAIVVDQTLHLVQLWMIWRILI